MSALCQCDETGDNSHCTSHGAGSMWELRQIYHATLIDRDNLRASLAKSESLAAEAVAREGARWRDELSNRVGKIIVAMDDGNLSLAKHFLVQAIAGIPATSDWLARHDAEVLRPWREAVKYMKHLGGCSTHYYGPRENECSCGLDVLKQALLSTAPASPQPKDDLNSNPATRPSLRESGKH